MKSFFRQQKAHAGATKPTGGVSKKAAAAAHHHQKAAPALHVHPSPGICRIPGPDSPIDVPFRGSTGMSTDSI